MKIPPPFGDGIFLFTEQSQITVYRSAVDLLDECTFLSMSTEKYQKNAPQGRTPRFLPYVSIILVRAHILLFAKCVDCASGRQDPKTRTPGGAPTARNSPLCCGRQAAVFLVGYGKLRGSRPTSKLLIALRRGSWKAQEAAMAAHLLWVEFGGSVRKASPHALAERFSNPSPCISSVKKTHKGNTGVQRAPSPLAVFFCEVLALLFSCHC